MIREARPRLTTIGKHKAILDGQTISYVVKRSPRARYARLEVRTQSGLTVVVPRSYDVSQISEFLNEKRRWILDKLVKLGHINPPCAGAGIKSGDTIPYLGRNLRVVRRKNSRGKDSIQVEGKSLVVSLNSTGVSLRLILESWYRREAEKLIRKRLGELSRQLGVRYGRLTIRGAKTRWGSCSQKGNLNFNWKLLMVPEPIIDYVIIHELAHLKEMNHSKKFWHLVGQHCPQWRRSRKWLKVHEAKLSAKLPG
jgi:predicted metal-dependent hydrolase